MKEEFNFNRIGKRMPYNVPEGFFDDMERKVWETVRTETQRSRPIRRRCLWYSISGCFAAAGITLLLVFNSMPVRQDTDGFERFEQAFSKLSSEDQSYMLAVYQEDLFINE